MLRHHLTIKLCITYLLQKKKTWFHQDENCAPFHRRLLQIHFIFFKMCSYRNLLLLVSQHLFACLLHDLELQSGADTGTRSAVYCFIGNCEATSEIGYRSYRLLPENHFNQPTNKGWKILLPTPTSSSKKNVQQFVKY